MAVRAQERTLGQVGLETGHAIPADDRVMGRPSEELEAVAFAQFDRPEANPNRMLPAATTMTLS